jgi:YVTN family beta-propeller protein
MAVAVSSDARLVYVTNSGDNTLSVIDTGTNQVVARVKVGKSPEAVRVRPDGKRVYVTNAGDNTVSVIDSAANRVVATLSITGTQSSGSPFGMSLSAEGSRLYVCNLPDRRTSTSRDATLVVIDTASNQVVDRISTGRAMPEGIAASAGPTGDRLYVADSLRDLLLVLDAATHQITPVPVGGVPKGVAVSPDSTRVYVANSQDNTVSVLRTDNNQIIAIPQVGARPQGTAVSPDGQQVFVTNQDAGTLSVLAATDPPRVLATIPSGRAPEGLTVRPVIP